ncbi:hypothetical protein ABID58_000610 [Bradyrhizobium sp. S3.2.6]
MVALSEAGAVLRLSPHAGRGRAALADRVRGALRELLWQSFARREAPHPNPLPVRTGRGGERALPASLAIFLLKILNVSNAVLLCMGLFPSFLSAGRHP